MTLMQSNPHGPHCACSDCMDRRRERDRRDALELAATLRPADCMFDDFDELDD